MKSSQRGEIVPQIVPSRILPKDFDYEIVPQSSGWTSKFSVQGSHGQKERRAAECSPYRPPRGAPERGSTREHVPSLGKIRVFCDFEPVHKRVAEQMSPKGCGCPRRDDRSRHAVGVQSLRLSKAVGRDYKNWGEIPVDSRHATV